jgi:hypothetical protein
MVKIYGIKNCDTMKKAFAWCDSNNISYEFHDYKKLGVPRERLVHWCRTLGWKTLINTKGPTWRKLTPGTAGRHHPKPGRGADDGTLQRDPPPRGRKRSRADPGRLRSDRVRQFC